MKLLASEKLHPRCIVTSAYFFFFEEDFFADFDFDADFPAFFLAAMHFTSDRWLLHADRTKNFCVGDKHFALSRSFSFRPVKIAIKNIRNFPVHIEPPSRKFSH